MAESYSISDTAKVDQIGIGNGSDSVFLNRTAQGWFVNGKRANGSRITALLSAFQSIEVFSPIPKMVDSVVHRQLLADNATVIRFGNAEKMFKKIRFAYTDTLGLGTVALAEGYSTGAVVRTASQEVRLVDLLSVNPSFWANSRLVTASESEITEVAFKNLEHPDSSFTLRRVGEGFQLFTGSGVTVNRRVNLKAVSRYLNYITRITTIAVAAEPVQPINPLYTLLVITPKGATTLDFIPIPSPTPLDVTGKKARFDYNSLFILMNGKDLYRAGWVDVDLTIKNISYFYE